MQLIITWIQSFKIHSINGGNPVKVRRIFIMLD